MYDSKYSGEQVEALLDKVNNLNNTGGDNSSCVQKTDENVQHIVGGLIIGSTNTPSAMQSGKHKGRIMLTGVENPLVGVLAKDTPYYVQAHENNMYIGPARPNATSFDSSGNVIIPNDLSVAKDIYENGVSLSKKYTTKGELTTTELYFVDYVKDQVKDCVKAIIVNNSNPIKPDSNGVVNLGYLGGGSTGDGETTLGSVLDVQIDGESIVTNGVAQIYKAATDRLGVVMLSNEYKEEDDDTKVVTQKALHNAYTEFKESENDLLEHFNTVQGLIPDIKIGNESIVEGNTVNLEEHFKTINNNSILGSGDMSFQDLISGNEGDGIYFNDGNDGRPTGLTIQCGNGLSINETNQSLQVNIGNGLAFDENGALIATGSDNVDLSGYVTDEELAITKANLEKEINSQGQQLTELDESAIRTIQINGTSFFPSEEDEGLLMLLFKNINGESILRTSEDDSDNIEIKGGDGTLDSSLYVTKEDFNNSLREKLNKELVYKWTISGNNELSQEEYSNINNADVVLIQDGDNIYVANKLYRYGQIVLTVKTINDSKELRRIEYTLNGGSSTYIVADETIQIPTYTSDLEDYEETTNLLVESLELSKYLTKEEFQQDISNYVREDMMYTYEGNGIYYNDGDDGENKSFNVYCGNGLSINDETKALQVNIGNGLAFDENTKALIATGSGDVDLSDYVTKDMMPEYEGDGIYFNDGDDGNDVGFTINCGEGLSINETTKALQVNTDDVNLRNRFKTINGNSIFGSGNIIANAYPRVDHGTSDTTFTLTPNVFHVWDNVESLTLTFEAAVSGVTNEYLFQFSCLDGQVTTLGLPEGIMWANGEVPTLEVLKTYQVSILNNCATIQSFG